MTPLICLVESAPPPPLTWCQIKTRRVQTRCPRPPLWHKNGCSWSNPRQHPESSPPAGRRDVLPDITDTECRERKEGPCCVQVPVKRQRGSEITVSAVGAVQC